MNLKKLSDESVIDYFYTLSVKGIDVNWFNENVDYNKWYNHVINLPLNQKVAYVLSIMDEEVSNGGFEQYFGNKYGIFIYEVLEALIIIKANRTAQIIDSVIKLINPKNENKETVILKIIQDKIIFNENELEQLDDLYFLYEDNLGELIGNYLRQ